MRASRNGASTGDERGSIKSSHFELEFSQPKMTFTFSDWQTDADETRVIKVYPAVSAKVYSQERRVH